MQIYAQYILNTTPDAKIAILYQNDDFGKDYLSGVKDVLKDRFDSAVTASFEVTDSTIDSQAITLQNSGANVLISVATPKFAAQIIRKVADMNWKPLHLLTNVSTSVGAVMEPAGVERGIGVISSAYLKDPTDPQWKSDAGLQHWRDVMKKYLPDADISDSFYVYGYAATMTTIHVLRACGNDFSHENLMRQASNMKDVEVGALLPGIRISSSPTNFHPIRQIQLMRWTGKTWELFGDVLSGSSVHNNCHSIGSSACHQRKLLRAPAAMTNPNGQGHRHAKVACDDQKAEDQKQPAHRGESPLHSAFSSTGSDQA